MIKAKVNRTLFLLAGIILAAGILGLMMWRYYSSPSSTFTLDVNPSIELQTNRLNQVVAVNPVNEDARQLLAGYELKDNSLEAVISSIVDRMILSGYLTPDQDNEILLTTEEGSTAPQLSESIHQLLSTYLEERQIAANTILQTVNATAQELQIAGENNLSVGKLRLIEELMNKDSSLTLSALSGMRISDLLAIMNGKDITLYDLGTESNQQETPADTVTVSPTMAISEDTDQDLEDANEAEDQDNEDRNIEDNGKEDKKPVKSHSRNKRVKNDYDASKLKDKDENDSDSDNEDYDLEEEDQEDDSKEDGLYIRKEADEEDQDDNESRYEDDEDGEDGGRHAVYAGEDKQDNGAYGESNDQGEDED